MMSFHALRFVTLFILLLVPAQAKQVEWKMKEYRGNKYVPLKQVQEFYDLTSMARSGRSITLKNSAITMEFQAGGQEVLMNNVKFIFSHSIVDLGSYHVSVTDLLKVIDPVLRPFKITPWYRFHTVRSRRASPLGLELA